MPTKLDCGVVTLLKEYTVCAEGDKLTSDQAKLLQLLNVKMATFKVILRAAWADGAFHVLDTSVNAAE
jgi:mRNA turnover protein 4